MAALINNPNGQPVAVTTSHAHARRYAHALAREELGTNVRLEWSDTNKLMHHPEDSPRVRWTGWEIRYVRAMGDLA